MVENTGLRMVAIFVGRCFNSEALQRTTLVLRGIVVPIYVILVERTEHIPKALFALLERYIFGSLVALHHQPLKVPFLLIFQLVDLLGDTRGLIVQLIEYLF
jgi:hypothetical protein